MLEISVLAAQITDLEFVERALSGLGAGRGVYVGWVKVQTCSAAWGVFCVKFGRNRIFVNVETSGPFAKTCQADIRFDLQ